MTEGVSLAFPSLAIELAWQGWLLGDQFDAATPPDRIVIACRPSAGWH